MKKACNNHDLFQTENQILFIMNKSILFAAILLASIKCFSQFPEPILKAQENKELATIVIYRTPQLQGVASNWAIFDSKERICKLSNKKYLIYQRKPGDAYFRAQVGGLQTWPKKVTALEIPLEAGETYYIKTNMKMSFTRARVELTEVVERAAKKELSNLSLDNCSLEK